MLPHPSLLPPILSVPRAPRSSRSSSRGGGRVWRAVLVGAVQAQAVARHDGARGGIGHVGGRVQLQLDIRLLPRQAQEGELSGQKQMTTNTSLLRQLRQLARARLRTADRAFSPVYSFLAYYYYYIRFSAPFLDCSWRCG